MTDSAIEQRLSEDQELFLRMADGIEDEEEAVTSEEETESVTDSESEEDAPTNEQDTDEDVEVADEDEDVEYEDEEEETTPNIVTAKLYTSEEIKELLADGDFSKVDTSRLSEEGKLVMKSMQSGLTPKLQEAAELRKQMQQLQETVEKAIPKPAPKDIYEAYDQDPEGVTKFINNKIDELIDSGADMKDVEKLRETRYRLKERGVKQDVASPVDQDQLKAQQTVAALVSAIPDIEEKQQELKAYAMEVMGYSEQELLAATALTRGEDAVKEIVRINNAYRKYTAPVRAKKKAKRKQPTSVEKSGGGFDKQDTTISDLKTKAKKTGESGDWFDVFYAMEED